MVDTTGRVPIEGSDRSAPDHERLGDVDGGAAGQVTLYLRGGEPAEAHRAGGAPLTREAYAAAHGADDDDVAAVRAFAEANGLRVGAVHRARRSIELHGSLDALARAFGTGLARYRGPDGGEYRGRVGPLTLPAALAPKVSGVFGLDDRPQASPQFRPRAAAAVQFTPPEVAAAYDFPAGATAAGQCVALIELGGGFRTADLAAYFPAVGVPEPAVVAVGVDGGTNRPGAPDGPDGEVMLDIEVVGGVAPGVTIAVYFAPNTDQGFIDAVTTAVHDTTHRPSVVSISWGSAESSWTAQAMNQMEQAFSAAAAMGVAVTVASGDNGSSDGAADNLAHVDFPASAPHALACGGTRLAVGPTGAWSAETVWNDLPAGGATGGGVSDVFDLPAWQRAAGVPPSVNPGARVGRGVPDVAGVADPDSGYEVRVDGQTTTVGGTSAVAPLWAGVIAVLNQALGRPVGLLHPFLYATGGVTHDITSGTNPAYAAGAGWDACTGLGSPIVTALLAGLRAHPPGGAG